MMLSVFGVGRNLRRGNLAICEGPQRGGALYEGPCGMKRGGKPC
jgi:hypothetical protein